MIDGDVAAAKNQYIIALNGTGGALYRKAFSPHVRFKRSQCRS